jgi:hypothetical protein
MMDLVPDFIKKRLKKPESFTPSARSQQESGGFFDQSMTKGVPRDKVITGRSTVRESTTPPPARLQRDPGKRQRIFVLSAAIVLLVFGLKIWGRTEWSVEQVVLVAAGAAVLSAFGLTWAFRFDITRRGYLTVIPQPALFVFGYVLFLEMFFFQRFERIYEALLFGALLVVFMMVLGIVFLTANILNVATIKNIPLLQVAQTTSYVITLFNAFFIGFFIVSLGLMPWYTILLLFVLYWAVSFLHLAHFTPDIRTTSWFSLGIACVAACAGGVLLLWPVDTLFRVLLPTVIIYIGVGIIMHDVRKALRPLINWEYFIILAIVAIILISRAVWGISGYLWS